MTNPKLMTSITLAAAALIALLLLLSQPVQAAPNAVCWWTGPDDSVPRDWSSVAYWDCGAIPGPNDTAVISGYGRVVNVDSPLTVQNLSLLNSSALNGFNTITVTGNMLWSGDLVGGAHLSPTGVAETVVIAPGAVLSITNPSRLLQGRLVNYGVAEHAAGQALELFRAVIDNRAGGTYKVTEGVIRNYFWATREEGGDFHNAGSLIKDGAGTFTLGVNLTNDGQVIVSNETLRVERSSPQVVTHSGSISIAAPGTLLLTWSGNHVFEAVSAISGAGTLRLNDGVDVTVRGAYNLTGLTDLAIIAYLNFETPGGGVMLPRLNMGNTTRLRGSNDITITEVMTISGSNAVVEGSTGVNNTLNIAPGAKLRVNDGGGIRFRTLNNYGTIEQASGQCFDLNDQAVFNNHPGGVYTVTLGRMGACLGQTSGSFNNQGRVDKLGLDTFEINSGIAVTNAGLIAIHAGTFKPNGQFVQTAGETVLSDGSTLSNQNYPLIFNGGALRGSGMIDLFQDRYLQNNGATIDPTGLLTLDEHYVQGVSGTLRIDIGGLALGNGYDQFSVGRQATLNGRLTITPTGAFTPASGDLFRVMTYGSYSGQFAEVERGLGLAFGPEYQTEGVVISDNPTLVEFSQRPDRRTSRPGQDNGFTLRVINPTTQTITATLSDALPGRFRYLAGSLSASRPISAPTITLVDDVQTLAWSQPLLLSPSSIFTLHFRVAQAPIPQVYTNTATIAFTPTQGSPRQIASLANVTISIPDLADLVVVPSQGVAYPPDEPDGPWRLSFRRGTIFSQVSVALTVTPVCPLPACGPLSHIEIIHADQIYSMTETSPGSNRFHFVIPAGSYLNYEAIYVTPVWLPATIKTNQSFAPRSADQIAGGNPNVLPAEKYDPSGFVTNAQTGGPIQGATVTLYRLPTAWPDTRAATNDCRTVDTRPNDEWNTLPPATEGLGLMEDPGFVPATIEPAINPQQTDEIGHYGWDVIRGCWYIQVEAPGYMSQYSPVVGVPPEVTDLDISLEPVAVDPSTTLYLPAIMR